MGQTKKIQKLESRIEDLEFAVQHLADLVNTVNSKYLTLTDALTRKVIEKMSVEDSTDTN